MHAQQRGAAEHQFGRFVAGCYRMLERAAAVTPVILSHYPKRKAREATRRVATNEHMLAMLRDDSAQGILEYALIVTFVAVVAVVALKAIAGKVVTPLNSAANAF